MNSGFYSAFAAFAARTDALEIIGNNLANANTVGFKSQLALYRSFADWGQGQGQGGSMINAAWTPINQAVNQAINHFGVLGGSVLDFSSGSLETTGNDTDVALEGSGLFAIQTKAGVRYTRAGNFSFNNKRQIVTADGDLVLGDQGPILVPPGRVAISADGTISVDGALVSKLKIVDVDSPAQLTPEGANTFNAPAAAIKPAANANVQQGKLEHSNSDPVRGTIAIIELERTSGLMEKALSIFHNEFNRTAAQQIPIV